MHRVAHGWFTSRLYLVRRRHPQERVVVGGGGVCSGNTLTVSSSSCDAPTARKHIVLFLGIPWTVTGRQGEPKKNGPLCPSSFITNSLPLLGRPPAIVPSTYTIMSCAGTADVTSRKGKAIAPKVCPKRQRVLTSPTLKTQFGSSPVATLGIVTNFIIGTKTDPLRDWSVLLGFLGQDFLDTESFLGRHSVASFVLFLDYC